MSQTLQIVAVIALFALIFGVEYLRITAKHRKEMAMIEAGMDPNKKKNYSIIRIALLFLFIPPGIYFGNYYADTHGFENSDITGIMVGFMFGGIALILANFIETMIKGNKSN